MKTITMTAVVLMLSATAAIAADDAKPGKVMDDTSCQAVWDMTERDGDTLSKGKAADFVVNYEMVDTDSSGDISADEFKTGCSKGWIQSKSGTDAE